MLSNKTSSYNVILESLQEYKLNKKIKDQLNMISPLLAGRENDIKVYLESIFDSGEITSREYEFLKTKMELGRMCLELEQVMNSYTVSMYFYDSSKNNFFLGAESNESTDISEVMQSINEKGLLNEDCGPCGRAIFKREVVQANIEADALLGDYRTYLMQKGYKSCASIPFYTSSGVLAGTFEFYTRLENHFLTDDDIEMVQEKTGLFQDEIQRISDRLDEYTKLGEIELAI